MKTLKKVLMCVIVLTFCLTGCATKKEELNGYEFEALLTEEGYNVVLDSSIENKFEEFNAFIKSVNIAKKEDGSYQFEFFLFDEVGADRAFNYYKSKFEKVKKNGSSKSSSVSVSNYSTYSLTTSDRFMYISRVNTTLLHIDVDKKYKDEVTKVIEKMGY